MEFIRKNMIFSYFPYFYFYFVLLLFYFTIVYLKILTDWIKFLLLYF